MIPLYIKISGFLSYQEPAVLDFTSFDLACVAGANGAGKSSLLDAITWALFGKARKQDDSLINAHGKSAEVIFIFSYEENVYRVQRIKEREKTTLLEFQIFQGSLDLSPPERIRSVLDIKASSKAWKTLSGSGLRETEARIRETLRLDYDTFVNASFFLQGKADQFTQQSPGDRKRILGSILGLDIWEVYRQSAAERRRSVEGEIASLDGQLSEINRELAEEPQRKSRLSQLKNELETLSKERSSQETLLSHVKVLQASLVERERALQGRQNDLEEDRRQLDEDQARVEEIRAEVQAYQDLLGRAPEIEQGYQSWLIQRDELQTLEQVAERYREQEKRREGPRELIKADQARLEQELAMLQKQAADMERLKSETETVLVKLTQAEARQVDLQKSLEQRQLLESQLEELRQEQPEIKAENLRLKEKMDELKARIDQLVEVEGANCPVCGQPLSEEDRQVMIENLQAQGQEMGDRYRANKTLLEENQKRLSELDEQKAILKGLEQDLQEMIKSTTQLSSKLDELEGRQQEWLETGLPRMTEIESLLAKNNFALQARAELAQIDDELRQIGYDPTVHDQARQVELAGRAWEEQHRLLGPAQAALTQLQGEFKRLESQVSKLKTKVVNQQSMINRDAAVLEKDKTQMPDVEMVELALREVQERENNLSRQVGAAQQSVAVLEDQKTRRKNFTLQREELARQVSLYKQLERAFSKDGVPALLIEQALPQIEAKANEILDRLSGGNMSVRFITQAAYKDKGRADLKETLDIQISDSAGSRDYEMFSGGEAFRVNFAIRLALSEVLAQRAGARLQTLVIDEGFGSQDAQGRQRLIEAINLVRGDFAKILVITHIDELKDAFPNRIEVEKTERGSFVRIV